MQINWHGVSVYLATAPVDMRKNIDGLSMMVADRMQQSPQSLSVYVFYNREHNKVKCLWWDKNGFVLYYKRLEKGRYKIPKDMTGINFSLSSDELNWLLAGLEFMLMREQPQLSFNTYF